MRGATPAEYNGFISNPITYTNAEVAAMTKVADVSTFTSGQKYSISSVAELQKLADYVNSGKDTSGVEFVLGADIDLSSISNWTPIGDSDGYSFCGIFNGNGHVVKNLKIIGSYLFRGLFGRVENGVIKNFGIQDASVEGDTAVGILAGKDLGGSIISNCYATGSVVGMACVGGLIGLAGELVNSSIIDCYAQVDVIGLMTVGGLAGVVVGSVENSYATRSV
jgi:hypothetical protein